MTPNDIIENLNLVAEPDYSVWIWTGALGVLLLAAGSVLIWFLYRRKILPFQIKASIPPHRTALADLEALRSMLKPERCREFVFEVSNVLRRYVEARFELKAPTLSSEEFLWLAESHSDLNAQQRFMLGQFLSLCDRVKFALKGLEVDAMEALLNSAKHFVEETMQAQLPQAVESV